MKIYTREDVEGCWPYPKMCDDKMDEILRVLNGIASPGILSESFRKLVGKVQQKEFDDKVKEVNDSEPFAFTPTLSNEELNRILFDQGVDPDTGKRFDKTKDEQFDEKFERKYGNIPR